VPKKTSFFQLDFHHPLEEGVFMSREYFTHSSESVTGGHPDKLCDLVAANVLDEAILKSLEIGKLPRVAMEVSAKGDLTSRGGTLLLFGEVSLPHGVTLDYETIASRTSGTGLVISTGMYWCEPFGLKAIL
jgi:hypothetical protein